MQAANVRNHATEPAPAEIYPDRLASAERALIAARRASLALPGEAAQFGIGISGGGIRSATFALGLFQALARRDLLRHIDYLSTVSGGGYFGGFLSKLFLSAGRNRSAQQSLADATAALADSQ